MPWEFQRRASSTASNPMANATAALGYTGWRDDIRERPAAACQVENAVLLGEMICGPLVPALVAPTAVRELLLVATLCASLA